MSEFRSRGGVSSRTWTLRVICVAAGLAALATTACTVLRPVTRDDRLVWALAAHRWGTGDTSRPKPAVAGSRQGKRWHIDFGFRTSHTKLSSTEQQLDRRLDLPLKTDILGVYDHPTTPIDRKSALGLNTFFLGVGRSEADWLAWSCYLVGGFSEDKKRQRFLNQRLSVSFKYALVLLGLKAEVYPWGQPRHDETETWNQRFRSSRPYVYGGVETGYISGEGRGRFSVFPAGVYADKVTVRDWVVGIPLGLGWRLPLGKHWSFTMSGDYTFHLYRPQEYNSWNVITGFRYRF